MEFKILKGKKGTYIISDNDTVQGFDAAGKNITTGLPSPKMFREMAYIEPPTFINGDSYENAIKKFIEAVR